MKKIIYLVFYIIFATTIQSCNDKDEVENISELEQKFFSIENATYKSSEMPMATTAEALEGLDMSNQVMNGAMNYITLITEQHVSKFFIGIKNVPGYWEYIPSELLSRASDSYNTYIIPVMMSQSYTGNATIVLSGQLDNGDVTQPVENEIFYIETMPGAIEVKLSFSNSKDVDLHLYTPSGEHIYYGNRGGSYTDEFGDEISYGLDIDSNAGCSLDNINKENIYIPAELVEDGTYTVVVDMYSNCQPSIVTSWSIIARYQGELITPATGSNPASGIYLAGAGVGDMTRVMTFTIHDGIISRAGEDPQYIRNNWKFTPTPLSETDQNKIDFIVG